MDVRAWFLFTAASFALAGCKLTIDLPNGGGDVVSDTSINCPSASCSESISKNTLVTLTAKPREGFFFGRWEGCSTVENGLCFVSTEQSTTSRVVKAYFFENVEIVDAEFGPGMKQRCVLSTDEHFNPAANSTLISEIKNIRCDGLERWIDDVDVDVRVSAFDLTTDENGEKIRNCKLDVRNPKNGKIVSITASFQSVSEYFGEQEEYRMCNWHVNDVLAQPGNSFERDLVEAGIPVEVNSSSIFYGELGEYPLSAKLDTCGNCEQWSEATLRTTSEKIYLNNIESMANLETILMYRGDISDLEQFLKFPNLNVVSLYNQALERVDSLLGLPSGMTEIGLQENPNINCGDVELLREKYGINKVFASQCF